MVRRWVEEGAKASLAKTAPSAWGQGYLFETLQVTLVLQAGLAGTNIHSHAGEILALQSVLERTHKTQVTTYILSTR
jgi:hypothetical protein